MKKRIIIILIVLIVLNIVVLIGQIIPENAPPFAGVVNIIFLASSFIYFTVSIIRRLEKK
ncbi:MAG: hypothetical protein WCR42_09925 [bacterium]